MAYHIMSRTALDGFPLGDVEKDYFVAVVKKVSRLYFVEVLGFTCMSNHFRLLVRMHAEHDVERRLQRHITCLVRREG
jgi:REP-associated tyrosine transposase